MKMYECTLPIVGEVQPGNFQFAYLALPGRFITEEEYQQMVKMIEILKPALVLEYNQQQEKEVVLPVFWNFVRGE